MNRTIDSEKKAATPGVIRQRTEKVYIKNVGTQIDRAPICWHKTKKSKRNYSLKHTTVRRAGFHSKYVLKHVEMNALHTVYAVDL